MKEYKYKIKGAEYTVKIDEVEGNMAKVEVNGIPFEVEMERPMHLTHKPVIRPVAHVHHGPVTPAVQPVQPEAPRGKGRGRACPAARHHQRRGRERGPEGDEGPDGGGARSHEDGEQHQRRMRRDGVGRSCEQGRFGSRRCNFGNNSLEVVWKYLISLEQSWPTSSPIRDLPMPRWGTGS